MSGAVFLGLAVVVGVGSAALGWQQARRAAMAVRGDTVSLALALEKLPQSERLAELDRRSQPGTWEHELATEALAAPEPGAQVAAVNLVLAEVEHALTSGAGWPRAGVRIALLGAALLAFLSFLDGSPIQWSIGIIAVGATAALTCLEAGRSAARSATKQREAVDKLVAAVFGDSRRQPRGRAGEAVPDRRPRRRR